MNFQSLPTVETHQQMLDKAFSRARKRADQLKASINRHTDKVLLQKKIAHEKIIKVRDSIVKDIDRVIDAYPDFSGLPEFYEQLTKTQLDIDKVKLSLGRMQGVAIQLKELAEKTQDSIRKSHDPAYAKKAVDSFYGRVNSMLKRTTKAFEFVEKARRILTTFPALKDECMTVALAGFPNVGKSTLLSMMTKSKPKIANYAFTTKTLNTGYYEQGYEEVQVVDTPGTLARFEKMNEVEQQAYLCLRYVANIIVMILDPTETYSLKEQERLLEQVEDHDKPLIIYLSKTDIADKKKIVEWQNKYDAITTLDELKIAIKKEFASL